MNKYVVYTVIVGNYDTVKQPTIIDNRFDYIIFSDSHIENTGIWKVREIDYTCSRNWLKARFPRFNTEISLPDYKASLYIDGNIQITSQYVYDRCIELAEAGIEWASIYHTRASMYSEMNAILGLGWVHDYNVIDWYKFLKRSSFPDANGLFENNIIFRLHGNNVNKVNSILWSSLEHYKFRRDQFALMYAIWMVPEIKTDYFLLNKENAWNNNGHFVCVNHNPHKRILDRTLWHKLRDRYVRRFYSSGDWEIYYTRWFDKLVKYRYPKMAMHLWTAYILVRYDIGFLLQRVLKKIRLI